MNYSFSHRLVSSTVVQLTDLDLLNAAWQMAQREVAIAALRAGKESKPYAARLRRIQIEDATASATVIRKLLRWANLHSGFDWWKDFYIAFAGFPEEQAICTAAHDLSTRVPCTDYLERALEVAEDTLVRLNGERTAKEVSA